MHWLKNVYPGPDPQKMALWLGVPPARSGYASKVASWKLTWAWMAAIAFLSAAVLGFFVRNGKWISAAITFGVSIQFSWMAIQGFRILEYTFKERKAYREVWRKHHPEPPLDG